ncbi:MAG: DUF3795 domain-containing protein [Candidatus Lokiarchaeota archaeon]|nr:DUF3795 domain-containing protein [Candidatus Lokiarchaeota archaeon]
MQRRSLVKTYPTIACCGIDCGLCPTYYTKGPSKCPGCCGLDFFKKHPSCSIITCCVKNNKFETCAQCSEFPCTKLNQWDVYDSFVCHRVSLYNLNLIKEKGIEEFINQQNKRTKSLKTMLEDFNEGRSKSFYCIASALLPIENLEESISKSKAQIKDEGIDLKDLEAKSKILKSLLNQYANKQNLELKLRKK